MQWNYLAWPTGLNPQHLIIRGRAREKPDSRQSRFTEKGEKVNLLLSICSLLPSALTWQFLALVGVTAVPQKPMCSRSPAALDIRQKGSAGKVLARGHIPYELPTCQEQDGGAGDLGEAVTWLKAHWRYGINHNTNSNSVLFCDSVTTSSPILQSAKQLSPLVAQFLWLSTSPQRVLQTYHLQDTTNWSIKINLFLRKV